MTEEQLRFEMPYMIGVDGNLFRRGEDVLIDEKDYGNFIYYREMGKEGDNYIFLYERKSRKLSAIHEGEPIPDGHIRVTLPLPVAHRKIFDYQIDVVNEHAFEQKQNFVVFGPTFEMMLKNPMPVINIGDDHLLFDFDSGLVSYDRETVIWPLENLDWFKEDGKQFLAGYYNAKEKEFIKLSPDITAYPKDIIYFKLPDFESLSPIQMALYHGKEPYAYLNKVLLRQSHKADLYVLSNSPAAKLIEENQKKQANIPMDHPDKVKRKKQKRIR